MPQETAPIYIEFTHKGWFGFCPVIIADPEGMCMVVPRSKWLDWLFALSEFAMSAVFSSKMLMDPAYIPEFPIRITGQFNPPLRRRADNPFLS